MTSAVEILVARQVDFYFRKSSNLACFTPIKASDVGSKSGKLYMGLVSALNDALNEYAFQPGNCHGAE